MFDQVSLIVMPKSSVMRLAKSTEMSHSVAGGTSPVFDQATVGKEISSATHGSSVARVAGKNRGPTKQWAKASEQARAMRRAARTNANEWSGQRSKVLPYSIVSSAVEHYDQKLFHDFSPLGLSIRL